MEHLALATLHLVVLLDCEGVPGKLPCEIKEYQLLVLFPPSDVLQVNVQLVLGVMDEPDLEQNTLVELVGPYTLDVLECLLIALADSERAPGLEESELEVAAVTRHRWVLLLVGSHLLLREVVLDQLVDLRVAHQGCQIDHLWHFLLLGWLLFLKPIKLLLLLHDSGLVLELLLLVL